jgi:hypothetical protein
MERCLARDTRALGCSDRHCVGCPDGQFFGRGPGYSTALFSSGACGNGRTDALRARWFGRRPALPEELHNPLMHVSAKMPTSLSAILKTAAARQARRQHRKASSLEPLFACALPACAQGTSPHSEELTVLVPDGHEK